jgi:predicted TIM-barrel fold metal-dependent hydrolase
MGVNGKLVIDGDGHVMEPHDLDRQAGVICVGGEVRGGGAESMARAAALSNITISEIQAAQARTGSSLGTPGGYDPAARLEDMDRVGIDAAVIYPTSALFFGPNDPIKALHDADFVLDCQRAYNDWLVEYCSAASDRLFGIGAVPLQSIERAVAEAHRIKEIGL